MTQSFFQNYVFRRAVKNPLKQGLFSSLANNFEWKEYNCFNFCTMVPALVFLMMEFSWQNSRPEAGIAKVAKPVMPRFAVN